MSTFISQFSVIAIIAIIALVGLKIFGYLPSRADRVIRDRNGIWEPRVEPFMNQGMKKNEKVNSNETAVMDSTILEVLDASGRVLHSYTVRNIKNGDFLSIGRSSRCDIQVTESDMIGREHARLSKDEKGWFVQDNESVNGLYDKNHNTRVDEVALDNMAEFYLANVHFRFKFCNPFEIYNNQEAKAGSTRRVETQEKKSVVRRHEQ